MKCLVAVKRVVDPDIHIRIKNDESGVETENVKMAMNPFDEIAIEEATKLKEKGIISEIIAISIGDNSNQETLRQALARGADNAVLIDTSGLDPKAANNIQPLTIAKLLKECVEKEQIDLVLMGKQAIDNDCNQTGQMLAALLKYSLATFASRVEITEENKANKEAIVDREIDGGIETIKIKIPAVITVDLRLNEPRFISLPNIMQAKRKPLNVVPISDFSVDIKSSLETLKVVKPEERKQGIIVESVEDLVNKLKHEAKVI